jgi:hypothetical protein
MVHHLNFDECHNYENDADQAIFIPLQLSANGTVVKLAAKLDTGADYCLFDREWADSLGINVESGPRRTFRGLAGRLDAFEHEVTIKTFDVTFARLCLLHGRNGRCARPPRPQRLA